MLRSRFLGSRASENQPLSTKNACLVTFDEISGSKFWCDFDECVFPLDFLSKCTGDKSQNQSMPTRTTGDSVTPNFERIRRP